MNGAIVGPTEGQQQYQGCRAVVAAAVRQWQHNNQLKKYRAAAAKGESEGEGNGGKNNRGSSNIAVTIGQNTTQNTTFS